MDIVQELPSPWRNAVREASIGTTVRATPSADEATVLAALAVDEAQHIEDVIARCGMVPARVGAALVSLELMGHARQLEGQRWSAMGARSGRP